jgi:hypothetical protein
MKLAGWVYVKSFEYVKITESMRTGYIIDHLLRSRCDRTYPLVSGSEDPNRLGSQNLALGHQFL